MIDFCPAPLRTHLPSVASLVLPHRITNELYDKYAINEMWTVVNTKVRHDFLMSDITSDRALWADKNPIGVRT